MTRPLQDQDARNAIHTDLDRNLMVLAGAGAGKTHELVERMVCLVRAGRVDVDRIAAITFTRKAAGEMRGRFHLRLREEAGNATGEAAGRLRRALERVDGCFIGTVHAFCGQILRERPVEAGLPPDFSELEDRDETVLQRRSWDRFVQQGFADADPRLQKLEDLGLRTEDLYPFFRNRCRFSDLPLKRAEIPTPDLGPAIEAAVAFLERVEARVPDPLPDRRDGIQEILDRARNFLNHRALDADADRLAFLELFASKSPKNAVTLKCWAPDRDFARQLRDQDLPGFHEEVLEPALTGWRQYVYGCVTNFVDDAVAFYDGERRATGALTFQDLLLRAADLLRRHPDVRAAFRQRYRCLFVDEFQDTDPVQAQVLLYLTGTDAEESDWRKLRPGPGSLFLVGDGKQSIYRFRRADLETFRLVGDRLRETGGRIVRLNTSFRALGRLCDWINAAFEPLFAGQAPPYQAEFGPLFRHRADGDDTWCVRRLPIGKVPGNNRARVAQQDADRIADFIAAALGGRTGCNAPGDGALLPPRAKPGDFMVLTRTTGCLDLYARALEARGIPYTLAGGGRLGESPELRALVDMLESIHTPDNPLPCLGYLRGPLVGLGDDELHAFVRAGGAFHTRRPLPSGLPGPLDARLRDALDRLDRAAGWLESLTPAAAFERILEDLGLAAFAAAGDLGASRAGNLLRVLALVRQWETRRMHWGKIVTELRALIDDPDYKIEGMTLETGRDDAVHLMNLHQAKGLQAPVVFLADPCDTSPGRHGVTWHVSRTGDTPFLSMLVTRPRGTYGPPAVLAEPPGWQEDAAEEERFAEAEELRLLYVAATRAQNLLVVSTYESGKGGPWSALDPALENVPALPEIPALPPPALPQVPLDREQERRDREQRFHAACKPSLVRRTVTGEDPAGEALRLSGPHRGRDYGTLVHRLFEAAVRDRLPPDESAAIAALLSNAGADPALSRAAQGALDAFRASELWRELRAAPKVYTEVPFATPGSGGNLPDVLSGVIDLVYRLPEGWKLVDYKTEAAASEAEARALTERHAGQVEAYAAHWQAITKEPVVEKGLYLTGMNRWEPV